MSKEQLIHNALCKIADGYNPYEPPPPNPNHTVRNVLGGAAAIGGALLAGRHFRGAAKAVAAVAKTEAKPVGAAVQKAVTTPAVKPAKAVLKKPKALAARQQASYLGPVPAPS